MSPAVFEAIAVVFGIVSVYLSVRENIWSWPTAIVNVGMYILVFHRARLYADMGLQVFYVAISFYGWYEWLHGGAGRTELTVAAEDARLILTRLASPRAEVRNLAHPSRDPSTRSRVVVGERGLRGPPRAETHVAALPVPGRVKTRQLGRCCSRRSDTRTDVWRAGRARDTRPIRKQ